MRVLGIESSCDETAAAVVDEHGLVSSDVVASQIATHAPYGGVVPELASRAHLENVWHVISQALAEAGGIESIDAIAVTQGPGLVGALLVGLSAGKALAYARGLPLVGVDHLAGHLFAPFLQRDPSKPSPVPELPFVALLASGGHTALYEVHAHDRLTMLGQTRDDAAGEAFDKGAKILGLGYPGGPIVDRLAQHGSAERSSLPRPMLRKGSLEFSFSGLKTAIARHVELHGVPEGQALADLCAAYQGAIVEVLARKAIEACKLTHLPRLVLAGGVAANKGLRARAAALGAEHGVSVFVPPIASCTDNAAMIAYVGARSLAAGKRDDLSLAPYSRAAGLKRGKVVEPRSKA
ncbi:MAG: tRNA (adenosine(37)-N6)-threonylcarbamoyltransferase complex transferase subunit TsaD [Sandaracinaceae bacterium]|nr:tRNA (adenosine(37)-N6)-threonylcarbamoyltransferase complex transferase subunit TsaD [Sandaracinaceae bacterium]